VLQRSRLQENWQAICSEDGRKKRSAASPARWAFPPCTLDVTHADEIMEIAEKAPVALGEAFIMPPILIQTSYAKTWGQ
jgi:hypothetical protein